jgi:D-3-phosphoglycerate dehydrogenase
MKKRLHGLHLFSKINSLQSKLESEVGATSAIDEIKRETAMTDGQKKTIIIDGDVYPSALALLMARSDVELIRVPLEDHEALSAAVTAANGILARSAQITPELIANANGLEVVSRHGVGYDRVNVEALSARNIPLTVTGTANSPTVAEHAMMFMLACAKRLRPIDR